MNEDMQDIRDSLARIETTMTQVVDIGKDHETRLRGLEKWRYYVAGGFVAVMAGVTASVKTFLGK